MAMIGGRQTYELGGALSDAKGQPMQLNSVSHGCPVALFVTSTSFGLPEAVESSPLNQDRSGHPHVRRPEGTVARRDEGAGRPDLCSPRPTRHASASPPASVSSHGRP